MRKGGARDSLTSTGRIDRGGWFRSDRINDSHHHNRSSALARRLHAHALRLMSSTCPQLTGHVLIHSLSTGLMAL